MMRLRVFIPLVLALGSLAAFDTWIWQSRAPLAPADKTAPPRVESRQLEIGLQERRQQVDALDARLEAGAESLDALERRVSTLEGRYRERVSDASERADLPATLEDIVAQRTRHLQNRLAADDASRRVQALSDDTGIPEDRIREALGR